MENPALTETTYYILLSLYHPRHGYGIMQETQQLSGGRVRLAAGTCTVPECPVRKGVDLSPAHGKREPQKRIPIDLRRAEGAQTGAGPAGGACCQWPRHFTGGTGMSETKTLHRNFWVWEFEKEERWLNEMAQEGWALQNAGSAPTPLKRRNPASTSSGLPCWTVPRILKVSWKSWKHRALGIASVGDISAAAPS